MNPTDLEEYVRQNYNAVGDTFFSQAEIFNNIWMAQMILARRTWCIRNVYSTSTVASTQEYAKPTNCISIKRITYDGAKLAKVTMREDDSLTITNSATTATGTPAYYYEWGDSIFLRPIPSGVGTLKIYSFDRPQEVTSTSALDVPDEYHQEIAWMVLKMMALKDKNPEMAGVYGDFWEKAVMEAVKAERIKLRGDAFVGVNDDENMQQTVIGQL